MTAYKKKFHSLKKKKSLQSTGMSQDAKKQAKGKHKAVDHSSLRMDEAKICSPPLSKGAMFQDPHWMPETSDNTEP